MKVSKRSQYALKAVLELSIRNSSQPLKTRDIARSRGISVRFLEIILNDLKHGGFIESRRGNDGGYLLARDPANITPGDIIEYIEGPSIVGPDGNKNDRESIKRLWDKVTSAISKACNDTNFREMAEYEMYLRESRSPSYCI